MHAFGKFIDRLRSLIILEIKQPFSSKVIAKFLKPELGLDIMKYL